MINREVRTQRVELKQAGTRQEDVPMRDPRIESPTIRVVYPSDDNILKSGGALSADYEQPTKPQPTPQPVLENNGAATASTAVATEQPHTCSLTWKEALKQHATFFGLCALLLIGLGIVIGKSK